MLLDESLPLDNPLIESFYKFYLLLSEYKERMKGDEELDLQAIFHDLSNFLLNAQETWRIANYDYTHYREAQYIFVALADDVMVNTRWIGQHLWKDHLLEAHFFNSHISGEAIFAKLDEYINYKRPLPLDLGILYTLALGLGFKGKYADENALGKLSQYKKTMYERIAVAWPKISTYFYDISKESYAAAIIKRSPSTLPNRHLFGMLYSGFFLSIWVITSILWHFSNKSLMNEASVVLNKIYDNHDYQKGCE